MPYTIIPNLTTINRVDANGVVIGSIDDTKLKLTAGEKIELIVRVRASAGINFNDTKVVFNPALFCDVPTGQQSANGYERTLLNANFPYSQMYPTGNPNTVNHSVDIERVNARNINIKFCFYVAADVCGYLPQNVDNDLSFFATLQTENGYLNNCYRKSAYQKLCTFICYTVRISSIVNSQQVNEFATLGADDFGAYEVQLNWYDDDCFINLQTIVGGDDCDRGQAGYLINKNDKYYDNNFLVTEPMKLSVFDDNVLTFTINCENADSTTRFDVVKTMLICEGETTNDTDIVTDTGLVENMLTFSTTSIAPGTFGNFGSGSSIQANIGLAGADLDFNKCYRIAIVMYDTANDCSYSVLSQKMIACAIPACFPDIKCFLGNFCKESETSAAIFTKHERIKSRIEIDFQAYFDCLAGYGITADITNLAGISFEEATAPVPATAPENGSYLPTVIIVNGNNGLVDLLNTPFTDFEFISQSGTNFELCATTCVPSDFDTVSPSTANGTNYGVRWSFVFDITLPDGTIYRHRFSLYKKIGVREFENETDDAELCVIFYETKSFLKGNKRKIYNLCDVDKIIVEVEKKGALLGTSGVMTVNLYQVFGADNVGFKNTFETETSNLSPSNLPNVQSELISEIPELSTNDFETFCIDVKAGVDCATRGIEENQQYYIDVIYQTKD